MLALHVAWDMSFPASIGEWHVPARPLYFLWQHHPTSKHKCTRKPAKTQNHHSGFGVCAVLSWTKLPSKCHSPQANQETITSDHGNGLKLFLPNHGPTTLFNTHRNPATRPLNQTKDPAKKIKHDAWDVPFPHSIQNANGFGWHRGMSFLSKTLTMPRATWEQKPIEDEIP